MIKRYDSSETNRRGMWFWVGFGVDFVGGCLVGRDVFRFLDFWFVSWFWVFVWFWLNIVEFFVLWGFYLVLRFG